MVIYPDDFSFADAGVGAMPFGANYAVKQIDADEWEALEDAGCVFLPTSRTRDLYRAGGMGMNEDMGNRCDYLTATSYNAISVYYLHMMLQDKGFNVSFGDRFYGFSVRLVQDY